MQMELQLSCNQTCNSRKNLSRCLYQTFINYICLNKNIQHFTNRSLNFCESFLRNTSRSITNRKTNAWRWRLGLRWDCKRKWRRELRHGANLNISAKIPLKSGGLSNGFNAQSFNGAIARPVSSTVVTSRRLSKNNKSRRRWNLLARVHVTCTDVAGNAFRPTSLNGNGGNSYS